MRGWSLGKGFGFLAPLLLLIALVACSGDAPPAEVVEPSPTATAEPTPTTPTPTPTVVRTPAAPEPTLPPVTVTATPTPTPTATPEPEPSRTQVQSQQPPPPNFYSPVKSMRLPSLGVDAIVQPIGFVPGIDRLKLAVPDPWYVGWYEVYDQPGMGSNSLFSAHKDYWPNIRGPFYALTDLKAGDPIVVVMEDGVEYVYEVFFTERYTRDNIPVADLIWPHRSEDPDLRRPLNEEWITLYTCGGDFVSEEEGGPGAYIHRDVVIGRLVETVRAAAP